MTNVFRITTFFRLTTNDNLVSDKPTSRKFLITGNSYFARKIAFTPGKSSTFGLKYEFRPKEVVEKLTKRIAISLKNRELRGGELAYLNLAPIRMGWFIRQWSSLK